MTNGPTTGPTTRPTLRGTYGMAASTHWLASQCAMAVLEHDGNAFDAVVAGCFVLHVAEPHMNGPGGEMPAIFATADGSAPVVLCGQGTAPAAATIDRYRSLGLNLIPGSGPLAAAVPGAVDALLMLLRDHGTRPLRDVLGYAIHYARTGTPLYRDVCEKIGLVQDLFVQHWPTSAALWLPGGAVPRPGQLHRNPGYADTLERLVTEGEAAGPNREAQIDAARRSWSQGFVAEHVERFQRLPHRDASGRDHAGLLTGQDLADFSASYETPVTADFDGFTIAKTQPWAQGPVLLQMLSLVQAWPGELDLSTAEGIHTVAEIMKLAFADREAWYGDTGEVPLTALLSARYAARRVGLVEPAAARGLRPGAPDGVEPVLPSWLVSGEATRVEPTTWSGDPNTGPNGVTRGDTCQIDVVDRWGNMISATPSGGWLHGSPTIPQLGFCLSTRMQMFWLEEGLSSSLVPGRRPRTTLSPTLVLRDGAAVLACGTPGGDQQDQWQLLFLLRHLREGLDLQAAIDAPTFDTTSLPSSFFPRAMVPAGLVVEDRVGAEVLAELARRGHQVTPADPNKEGWVCAVSRDPATGTLGAGASPRGMHAYAVGR